VKAALSVVPKQTKEEMAVYFLTEYKEDIVNYINRFAAEQQIAVQIQEADFEVVKNPGEN
jgi:Holliday junction resolvase